MDQDEAKRVVEMRYGLVIREDPFLPAKLPMLAKRTKKRQEAKAEKNANARPWASPSAFTSWMKSDEAYTAMADKESPCKVRKKSFKQLMLRFHPDKFRITFPEW